MQKTKKSKARYFCECDTYCQNYSTFKNVEEFLDMCGEVFGEYPQLTSRINMAGYVDWYDEKNRLVLREIKCGTFD